MGDWSTTGADVAIESPKPPALPRGSTVDRYVIEEPLGEGGMGVVYVAHDPQLGRNVALKLLRPEVIEGREGSDGRSRFVREAHAMAKLNHPNVVAIYDAGVFEDQVFLAVELVDGTTVRAWLDEAPRGWREVLDVFLKAGHGLAAAHAAGLVHRDFKPENVLLGKRGEVKVADFGLARAASDASVAVVASDTTDPILDTPVTRAGVVAGTPAYMAPEQFRGQGGDARTDQFSFCVSLYRSLYDELPYEQRMSAQANKLRAPPAATKVPAWVRRALLRGLAIEPDARFATLAELLDALADDPAVRRRRLLAFAGMVALLVGAIAITALIVVRQRAAGDPCHAPERALVGVWDDAVRARVHGAYARQAMDRAANAWLGAYRDACAAHQPETALKLRLDCLDDQRFDLRAAGEIMAEPDDVNASAIGAAIALPLPLECSDARALSVIEQPSAERRGQVEALRLRLAHGRALSGAARYREALAILEQLPDEAKALEAPALQANALVALAIAYVELHDYTKAIETNTLAERVAAAAHMDSLATQAAASVVVSKQMIGSPPADIARWLDRARDDQLRAGSGTVAEFYVERARGFAGTAEGGDVHTRRVLALAEKLFGSDRPETMHAANEHANNLAHIGKYDESIVVLRKAIADADAIFGPLSRRAVLPQVNLAEILCDLGRTTEAEQAVDNLLARLGTEEQIQTAVGLAVRATLQAVRGDRAESTKTAGRAIEIATKLGMLANPNWAPDLHRHTIEAYLRDHEPAVALDEYERFLADLPADRPDAVNDLRLGGWAYLDAGKPAKAVPILEQALELATAHPLYPGWVDQLRAQLAQARR